MPVIERLRRRLRDELGFTLIELLATVIIMGVIGAGIVGVVVSYLRFTVDTQSRMTESQDVQFAAVYWQRDVASIGVRRAYDEDSKTFPLDPSVEVDPDCVLPSGDTVVTLAWSDYETPDSTSTPTKITVTYVARSNATDNYELIRVRCTGANVDSTIEVAHSLNVVPTATCDVACTGSGANVPRLVYLHLSVLDPDGNGTTAYTATLTGERRQT
ncbi:type II secretion system protein J [Nocardioides sp. Root190]|uniref:PulJ/GspJ family protein n=1 Tax=Nocardioides sp. Root190 TaxID=1736488 RepID=UPI000B10C84D|nr:type II secretion system protein [Nocardioides sp. Root190]